jgi:hypothetical protein
MVSGGLPDLVKKTSFGDIVFLLTVAGAQLRVAQDVIDRSGYEILGAQVQVLIDTIAAAILKHPHDND